MPILDQIIATFVQAAPYLLLGLFFSAIVQSFVPKERIATWIGKNDLRSVFISAAAGVPIPLCSCGVIPMAMSLRKSGASRGATLSFLISTPETGLDSIMLSFALLDPVMAIFRPLAAFVTAIIAGIMENIFDKSKEQPQEATIKKDCCSQEKKTESNIVSRLKQGFYNTFVTLLEDIAPWLLLGLVVSGVISYFVPSSLVEKFLGGGFSSMLLMLAIGIPMYICASASTPIAATLLLKGASPAAALVFLLAGPATNVTTMMMVYRFLGARALVIYLSAISICALGFGYLLNFIYHALQIDIHSSIGKGAHCIDTTWQNISAVVLVVLMVYALVRKYLKS